ncbi:hypothetical protein QN277_019874 [Acacia crassicarpa]|uniref:F-box domain-containing protein n=1 Tax=Acacia crassicarpa TaxID=499986 RepID=A0AAE1JIE5_9FABA|nr:hypothetical protein QN277_019874 [Acacia crassicarpa]
MIKNKRVEDDTPFLPEGILIDILIRLPVKSLTRFQCVCRDWRNLLKAPSFIADHLHHSNRQNPYILFQPRYLLYASDLDLYSLDSDMQVWRFQNSLGSDMQVWRFQNSPLLEHLNDPKIVGVSNGLLCVQTNSLRYSLFLWNPAIKEVKLVPETDFGLNSYSCAPYYIGFGFCPSLNDYKIVVTSVERCFEMFKVYSLRSNSWKEVTYRHDACNIYYRVTVNGVMFWWGEKIIRRDHGEYHCEDFEVVIFSFDLATEVWTVIPVPEQHSSTVFQNLMVYEGKLAFVFCCTEDFEHSVIHLWVREEGVGASRETWNWSKKFTSNPCPGGLFPKTMLGNEIFCMDYDSESTNTVLFNPTTEKFKKLYISKCDYEHQIFNYVESLVSVGGTKSLKFLRRLGSSSWG